MTSNMFWNFVRLLGVGWLFFIGSIGLAGGLQPLPVLASQVSYCTRSPLVQKGTHTLALDRQLCQAAQVGDLMRVKNLAAHGACINAAQQNGWTALMLAANSRRFAVVKFLLNHGSDVHRRSVAYNDVDALMLAAQAGNAAICRLLLNYGVDVNETDVSGNTPLMLAMSNSNLTQAQEYEVAKVLLNGGAKINAKNRFGQTALDYTQRSQFEKALPKVINLLKKSGAKM